jgi:hypothetical protein
MHARACRLAPLILVLATVFPAIGRAETVQGVTKQEILVGTLQDLSGPIAAFGKEAFNAMSFSKTKRLGSDAIRISRTTNGRWVPITDFISP